MIGKNEMFRKTVVGEGIFPNRIVHVQNKIGTLKSRKVVTGSEQDKLPRLFWSFHNHIEDWGKLNV